MQLTSTLCFLLVCYCSVVADGPDHVLKPDIYSLHVDSDIRFRFAHTVISSRIANPNNVSQEVSFSAVLPETAFISGFLYEVDGHVHKAYVKEKEEARQEYNEAVSQGRTAAHVALSGRDTNRFTVSVNVKPQKDVTFNLTYEELLNRKLGTYKHVINLDPGQIVRVLRVAVHIEETSDISKLVVPALRTSNEIDDSASPGTTNPLCTIERPTPRSAVVVFAPTPDQQRELASEGIKGQLVVEYDVDRSQHPGEVLVNDGYFVHFFAPSDLAPLPKQVTFVLDVSGSMGGRKIEQLRLAMAKILDDLNPADLFSIVIFSTEVQVWNPALGTAMVAKMDSPVQNSRNRNILGPRSSVIAEATGANIARAKRFVGHLTRTERGATNIYGALMKALDISKLGRETVSAYPCPEPIVIFLTDGQPNVEESDTSTIVTRVTSANTGNSSIFSIALGNDADMGFLKKLSLRNTGFARKIYETSDTALQLRDFYRQVASPLLANVTFKYQPEQVQTSTVTKKIFRRLFSGSELVVAGRLQGDNVTGEVEGVTSSGLRRFPFVSVDVPLPTTDIPKQTTVPVNTTPSTMERLWAYITIHQLLEEDEAKDYDRSDKNYTSPEKQQALDLALRYSFVIPSTPLKAAKPSNTSSVVHENASQPGDEGHPAPGVSARAPVYSSSRGGNEGNTYRGIRADGGHVFGGNGEYNNGQRGGYGNGGYGGYNSGGYGGYNSGGYGNGYGGYDNGGYLFHRNSGQNFEGYGRNSNGGNAGSVPWGLDAKFPCVPVYADLSDVTWLSPDNTRIVLAGEQLPVSSASEPLQVVKRRDVSLVHTEDAGGYAVPTITEMSRVTWLPADNTSIVFPSEELHIASANETDTEHGVCQSPVGPGHCRHFRYCVLNVFTSLQADYLPYMCTITPGYAGVCCPEKPALTTLVSQQDTRENRIELPTGSTTRINQHHSSTEIRGKLHQEILRHFNQVSAALEEIIKVYNEEANYKPQEGRYSQMMLCATRPSLGKPIIGMPFQAILLSTAKPPPLGRRSSCSVSKDKLKAFRDVINTTLSSPGLNCDDVKPLSDNCVEMLKLIQCGINHLRKAFLLKDDASLSEVTMWKIAYNILLKNNEESDASGRSFSDKYKNLSREYQELEKLLNDRQNELKDKKRLCISEISNGRVASAASYFNEMKDDSQLPEIIKTVYTDYGKLEILEQIIDFVKQLSCDQARIAYPVLFNTMKTYSHSKSPKVLNLFEAIKTCMGSSALESEVLASVKEVVNSWVPTWATDARNGNDNDQVTEVSQKFPSLFESCIDTLIANAYANNVKNVENILKFIDMLLLKDKILALSSLLDKMKLNNDLDNHELLLLAYRAKELGDYNPNMSQDDKDKLTSLQNSLPPSVRRLIWNPKKCSMRCLRWNEYMYAPAVYYNEGRRYVFTWIPDTKVYPESYWSFEAEDRAKSFSIKSLHTDEYLYSPDNNHLFEGCCGRRYAFTWRHKGNSFVEGHWLLEPVKGAKYFAIKNVVHNEYLYAAAHKPHDNHRRYVLTWSPGDYDDTGIWDITC